MVTWIDRLIFVLPPYHLSGRELAARCACVPACVSWVYTPVIAPPLDRACPVWRGYDLTKIGTSRSCFREFSMMVSPTFLQLKLHFFSENLSSPSKAILEELRRTGKAREKERESPALLNRRCRYCSTEFPLDNYMCCRLRRRNIVIKEYIFRSRIETRTRLW